MLPLLLVFLFFILPVLLLLRSACAFNASAERQRAIDEGRAAPDARRCHACGYDLRATRDRCPECGELVPRTRRPLDPEKLRDDWPAAPIEPRVPNAGEPLVVLWHAPHAMAADLLVAQLQARGVPAKIKTEQQPMQIGVYVPGSPTHSVAVWSDDAELAELLLARFERDVTPSLRAGSSRPGSEAGRPGS